ncbi:hypothetical protein ADK91_30330 [Streptomyces sp. XY511]|nr:hypothetical protein ADK91_30330 [Streptomyces sp. XY511]
MLSSLRFTAPALFTLGLLNAITAQLGGDRGALATALCLCVCAAGLFVEDQLQRGLRRDQRVLAYVGAHPTATVCGVSQAVGISDRQAEASLARLAEQALVSCADPDAAVPMYSVSD